MDAPQLPDDVLACCHMCDLPPEMEARAASAIRAACARFRELEPRREGEQHRVWRIPGASTRSGRMARPPYDRMS